MVKGWLVVNGFLNSGKFDELYRMFTQSAQQLNIDIRLVSSDSLATDDLQFVSRPKPDFVLFWDKDVCLAKRMEKSGLKLFNGSYGVEMCDNKALTYVALQGVVPMPKTVCSPKTFENVGYGNLQFVSDAVDVLGLPVVIKEAFGSFGQQVYLAQTVEQAKQIVSGFGYKPFIMQQFIAESAGRDVRVNVVGGKVVNAILRQSSGDFRSNITLGGTMSAYLPTDEQVDVAEKACAALQLDFAGVDILFGKNGALLCEVNSNPHFKTTWQATGVDLSKNILQHILKTL